MKIGVIGAGAVGSASLLSAVLSGDSREIVVVNRDRKRARAVVTDLQYGASLCPGIDIRDGDYRAMQSVWSRSSDVSSCRIASAYDRPSIFVIRKTFCR